MILDRDTNLDISMYFFCLVYLLSFRFVRGKVVMISGISYYRHAHCTGAGQPCWN